MNIWLIVHFILYQFGQCADVETEKVTLQRQDGYDELNDFQASLDEDGINFMFYAIPDEDIELVEQICAESAEGVDHYGGKGTRPGLLEITSPDMEEYSQYQSEYNGVFHNTYFPKNQQPILLVTEYGEQVWAAQENEEGRVVELHSTDEEIMMVIHVYQNEKVQFKHLIKVEGNWVDISLREFFVRLNEMMKNPDDDAKSDASTSSGEYETHI